MKGYLLIFILLVALLADRANGNSCGNLPETKSFNEAKSLSYLQRSFFSLEQALYYAEMSQKAKALPSFDYEKLSTDLELIKNDLGAYLYPRKDRITGETVPFRIEGDYFMNEIYQAK